MENLFTPSPEGVVFKLNNGMNFVMDNNGAYLIKDDKRIPLSDRDVEFAPVIHAHWIYKPYDAIWYGEGRPPEFVCSECEGRSITDSDFCPDCGAKMDEKVEA